MIERDVEKPVVEKESVKALMECMKLQIKKANDYQNPNSTVKQAMYYPHGIQSIYDMMNTKMLRLKSLMDAAENGVEPNNESLEDSCLDLINYSSFFVSWLRKKIDGQDLTRNIFNK